MGPLPPPFPTPTPTHTEGGCLPRAAGDGQKEGSSALIPAPSYLQLQHGDWFCGKAVGLLVLHLSGLVLNAYVTHVSEAGSAEAQAAWSWEGEMGCMGERGGGRIS